MIILHILLLLGLSSLTVTSHKPRAIVVLEWKYINYTWPSSEIYNRAVKTGAYVPINNFVASLKVWNNVVYVTLPRYYLGVSATLAAATVSKNRSPLLKPYPSWDMNVEGNCSALQSVKSMEVDPAGRMWVIDNGRSSYLTNQTRTNCPAKIVVLDLNNNGKVLMVYEFPDNVIHRNSSAVDDIVVDHTDGGWAYVSDADMVDPGIVVFSLKNRVSWKIRDRTIANPPPTQLTIENITMTNQAPIDGLALSPVSQKVRLIHYSNFATFNTYTLPVAIVRQRPENVSRYVKTYGPKATQGDGMGISAAGVLYYGLLGLDAVGTWDTKRSPNKLDERVLVQNHTTMQWPNSFGFDTSRQVWFLTDRAQRFRTRTYNLEEVNYRIISVDGQLYSYQYYEDGSVPKLPRVGKCD